MDPLLGAGSAGRRWRSAAGGRGALRLGIAAQVAVWLLISVGGASNRGYHQYDEYLSSLAAEGARSPGWGLAALALLAAGFALLVPCLWRLRPFVGAMLLVAVAAAAAVTTLRVPCPPRAEFCADSATSAVPVGHVVAVGVFAAALLATVVAGVAHLRFGRLRPIRLWPLALLTPVAVAAVSVWLAGLSGLPQRAWLAAGQVAVVALAAAARQELARRERQALKAGAASPPGAPASPAVTSHGR